MKLSDFRVLSFDCYGTLVDWESGIWSHLSNLCATSPQILDRETVLTQYSQLEPQLQNESPWDRYPDILRRVYHHFSQAWACKLSKIIVAHDADRFGFSVPNWPVFPDTVQALQYLKQHYKLVILSNVDRASFQGTQARLGVAFDAIYTAEDIGSYKPDRRNFEFLIRRVAADLGVDQSGILHTAQSLFHDHIPAKSCGLANAWIDRRHGMASSGATQQVHFKPTIDFHFKSLAEMVDSHQKLAKGST